jgi:pimeloyl-ACP methyl ester carboxylesterase
VETRNVKCEMRNAEYPFEGHFLDVGGVRMHYLDEGPRDAPPIVMVHGNPTWSFYFRHLISAFRGEYRVIVPDHIGMGLSDKPDEDRYQFTLARRVDDLERLIDSLKLTQPMTLVLHDWGGMIGMAYATRHPERIARLVLLNTGGFTLPRATRIPWQLKLARFPVVGALLVRGLNAFSRGAVKQCVMKPMRREVARAYCAPYNSWHNRLAVHRFIQDIPLKTGDRAYGIVAEVEEKMGQFRKVPTLICWGMKDFVFDEHFLNRWVELLPGAEVHRFAEAGHYVLEDAGGEIVALMEKFFQGHPLEAATV